MKRTATIESMTGSFREISFHFIEFEQINLNKTVD